MHSPNILVRGRKPRRVPMAIVAAIISVAALTTVPALAQTDAPGETMTAEASTTPILGSKTIAGFCMASAVLLSRRPRRSVEGTL